MRSIRDLTSWLTARRVEVVQQISRVEARRNPRSSRKRTRERVKDNSGCSNGEADRETTNATQLDSMDKTTEGLDQGRIPAANAQALARLRASLDGDRLTAFDRDEPELAQQAAEQPPDEFRKTLRDWAHRHSGDDGIDDAQRRRARRRLSLTTGDDAMGLVRGELDPESFEIVRRAVTDIANELWHGEAGTHLDGARDISPNARLMADALVELARRGAGVDADGGRRNRPTVIVTIGYDELAGAIEGHGVHARWADGTPMPAETVRRLACDANIIPTVLGGKGQPLDVGRARRLATDAQRTALRTQYDGCAFRGCDRPFDWCHIHHLRPWQAGGRTDLENLVPLCGHHHHLAHEGGWTAQRKPDGTVQFVKQPAPSGRPTGSPRDGNREASTEAPRHESRPDAPPSNRRRSGSPPKRTPADPSDSPGRPSNVDRPRRRKRPDPTGSQQPHQLALS